MTPKELIERTDEEIKREIAHLRICREKVRPRSLFGDDNVGAIDAQIKVLEEKLDDDGVEVEWNADGENHEDYVYQSAREASDWLFGDSKESPADGWAELARITFDYGAV